tara:strand:+ start:154 stop:303 length:150 start_codon:yes stop_codon:yes gene_type:complete
MQRQQIQRRLVQRRLVQRQLKSQLDMYVVQPPTLGQQHSGMYYTLVTVT